MSQRRSQQPAVQPSWVSTAIIFTLLALMAWSVLASLPIHQLRMPGLTTRADVFGLTEKVQRDMLRYKGKAGPTTRQDAEQLLKRDPASGNALTFMGLAAERDGKPAQALAYMNESLRREPRGAGARAWFVYRAVQQDNVDEALKETERLMALVPDALPVALQIFVYFSERPEAQPRLMAMLKRQKGWHDPFLAQLAGARVEPETLARLGGAVAKGGTDNGRSAILFALIQRGEAAAAKRLWQDALPAAAKKSNSLVYDPAFAKLPGLAPFNWSFTSGEDGSAEIDGDRGVAVDYFGRGSPVLAEQVLQLKPGAYTLRVEVTTATPNAESLSWGVYCARTVQALNKVQLAPIQGGEAVMFRANFVVPAWCDAQSIKLEGSPPDFPAVVNATIRSVNITAGAARSSVQEQPAS